MKTEIQFTNGGETITKEYEGFVGAPAVGTWAGAHTSEPYQTINGEVSDVQTTYSSVDAIVHTITLI